MAKATGKGRAATRSKSVKKPTARKKPTAVKARSTGKKVVKKKTAKKTQAAAKRPAKAATAKSGIKKPSAKAAPAKAAPKKTAAAPRKAGSAKVPEAPAKAGKAGKPAESGAPQAPAPLQKPARNRKRRSSRRAVPPPRRGPDGELLAPGELLLPKGPRSEEEVHYLLRGCVAGEEDAGELGVAEVMEKQPDAFPDKEERLAELREHVQMLTERFEKGPLENNLPVRSAARYTFEGIVDRAKQRRREIGAFLRGLDLARTESSHMDSHGEASLQGLMEWAARLEKLIEAEEPDQGDYAQFHRGMDQLDHTTESLLVDVEQTLKRLGKRARARR
jgi:hypothetical protein